MLLPEGVLLPEGGKVGEEPAGGDGGAAGGVLVGGAGSCKDKIKCIFHFISSISFDLSCSSLGKSKKPTGLFANVFRVQDALRLRDYYSIVFVKLQYVFWFFSIWEAQGL